MNMIRTALLATLALLVGQEAHAFSYTSKESESAASLAQRMYGRLELESVIAMANGLEPGAVLPPGTRIEIPTVTHHRTAKGEGWQELADAHLGTPQRAEGLALLNNEEPWVPPAEGQIVRIPYPLRYRLRPTDTLVTLAQQFLGSPKRAGLLARYNDVATSTLAPGRVLIVPVVDLPLTDAAKLLDRQVGCDAGSDLRELRAAQEAADAALATASDESRAGRWIAVIARVNRIVGLGHLSAAQGHTAYRLLTEAYVAIGAEGLAREACAEWKRVNPTFERRPELVSPKILAACGETPAP